MSLSFLPYLNCPLCPSFADRTGSVLQHRSSCQNLTCHRPRNRSCTRPCPPESGLSYGKETRDSSAYHENIGRSHIDGKGKKIVLQIIILFSNQRKKVHLLHQGYGYTLQKMIEKCPEVIRTFVAKYVKCLDPLLSVVDTQRKLRDALKVTKVSIFLTSSLAGGARNGPSAIYPTPPALVSLWHLAVLPNAQSNHQ